MSTAKWRVGHRGRDAVYYEERHLGRWRRIEIQGEMLMGRAHHVLYFASPERWQEYPAWARDRREEIIGRVKAVLRPPEYDYDEPDADDVVAPTASPSAAARRIPQATASQRRALLLAIVLLLAMAGGTAWLVHRGVATGTALWPARRATPHRAVSRAVEPAMFWFAIGLYGVVAITTGGLAALGVRELYRLGR